jgi:hypothetical protein
MKFLCVECDEAMKLTRSGPDDDGALTAVFACPSCGRETAMLTNVWETEVVQSLGVKVGSGSGEARCPFGASAARAEEAAEAPVPSLDGLPWTADALERLERIPEFVRPMARRGIEEWARSENREMVTVAVLDEARGRIGGI